MWTEVEKLLRENEVNDVVNMLSLNEGLSNGQSCNEVERDQPNRRNNLEQMSPKPIRAQGSIRVDFPEYTSLVKSLDQHTTSYEDGKGIKEVPNMKDEKKVDEVDNNDMELVWSRKSRF